MKELTFEVRFQELRTNGDNFKDVKETETEFHFMLNRNPDDEEQVFVGVSAFTKWTFASDSSAIIQCVCAAFPKAFLITDMTFDEYVTVVEAAIGQINLDLPSYLSGTPLPDTLQIENLNQAKYLDTMRTLYDEFKSGNPDTAISTFEN
jgi:hypothetical protein